MVTTDSSTSFYTYKKWQLVRLAILIPSAYGGISLSTLIESLAAAFLTEIPDSPTTLFLILLLFTLIR